MLDSLKKKKEREKLNRERNEKFLLLFVDWDRAKYD